MLNKGNLNDLSNVIFHLRENDDWNVVHLDQLMDDKSIVIFGLPGAFTPTCSTQQLPGYESLYDQFINSGVDEVYCTSVNDTFVMNAWFESQGIEKVKPLADGCGDLARSLGMLVKKDNLGFGMRSWRYVMLVVNGTVELFFPEPNRQDDAQEDPYGSSTPEMMLNHVQMYFSPDEQIIDEPSPVSSTDELIVETAESEPSEDI
jgi:peroxiredoxin